MCGRALKEKNQCSNILVLVKITQGPTRFSMGILEGVKWQTSRAAYNEPKQQCRGDKSSAINRKLQICKNVWVKFVFVLTKALTDAALCVPGEIWRKRGEINWRKKWKKWKKWPQTQYSVSQGRYQEDLKLFCWLGDFAGIPRQVFKKKTNRMRMQSIDTTLQKRRKTISTFFWTR